MPDGWATTCELLGENVTTGVVALKDGDEAMLTVPLQIVCTLLVSTCWTCAGLSTIEEGGETGFWDCNMTFSLRTVMGCEVGMACKMNFWGVAAEAGSVLAITVVRGTVWSVTVCSCWFPGETTTGTWAGVCKVLLRLGKIIGSEHFHREFWKIITDLLLKNYSYHKYLPNGSKRRSSCSPNTRTGPDPWIQQHSSQGKGSRCEQYYQTDQPAFQMFSNSSENLGTASQISFSSIDKHHKHDTLHLPSISQGTPSNS